MDIDIVISALTLFAVGAFAVVYFLYLLIFSGDSSSGGTGTGGTDTGGTITGGTATDPPTGTATDPPGGDPSGGGPTGGAPPGGGPSQSVSTMQVRSLTLSDSANSIDVRFGTYYLFRDTDLTSNTCDGCGPNGEDYTNVLYLRGDVIPPIGTQVIFDLGRLSSDIVIKLENEVGSTANYLIYKQEGDSTNVNELPPLSSNLVGGFIYYFYYICDGGLAENGDGTGGPYHVVTRAIYNSDNTN